MFIQNINRLIWNVVKEGSVKRWERAKSTEIVLSGMEWACLVLYSYWTGESFVDQWEDRSINGECGDIRVVHLQGQSERRCFRDIFQVRGFTAPKMQDPEI